MKALKSKLAKKILKTAFYDKELANKIRQNQAFVFEKKLYLINSLKVK